MSLNIVPILVQGCVMTVVSNVLATAITSYKQSTPFSIDWKALSDFLIWCIISTPPNIFMQHFLETMLPGRAPKATTSKDSNDETQLNVRNTIVKFLIDQSLCSAANTLGFSMFMNSAKGQGTSQAWRRTKQDFWPLIRAGWSLWPWVSLVNYTFIQSIEGRAILGNLAGLVWGIFLSLSTAVKLS